MRPRLGVNVADPSTWRGLGMMVVGYAMDAFTPDTNRWFIPLMLIIVGAVGFFVREDRPVITEEHKEALEDLVRRNQDDPR